MAQFDLKLPKNPELAAKLVDVQAKSLEIQARSDERMLEMGLMGRAFGSV